MYQFLKKIKDVLIYQFHNDDLITIQGNQTISHLTLLSNDLKLQNKLDHVTAYDIVIYQNNIFITESNSYDSYLLNLTDHKLIIIKKLEYTLNIKGNDFKNYYIASAYIGRIKCFILINLETSKILKKMPITLGLGFVDFLISDNLIISANSDSLGLFTLDNEKIWTHNINDILIQEKKGTIRAMKIYNDNVIIVSELGYISINIATGKINWATDGYADVIEVVGNIGYVGTNHSLSKINLDTGLRSGYGWEYNGFPDFEYNGEKYGAVGYGVIYHEGLLWYAVYDSGQSFIIAINLHDGYYEWILNVKEANKIDNLKFHNNRMYIRDVDNNLFVYENI
ncbi:MULTISPECIES: hypothetical protein [unclassified Flavobacterium]|uniref:hypothetical protein n=1 Tax=unclassified Flavobacterium TaxID=196869 RepID=UPI00131B1C93|nr:MULTISPECIES: hypothetical protein [unclassified Flavobacterium]